MKITKTGKYKTDGGKMTTITRIDTKERWAYGSVEGSGKPIRWDTVLGFVEGIPDRTIDSDNIDNISHKIGRA